MPISEFHQNEYEVRCVAIGNFMSTTLLVDLAKQNLFAIVIGIW